MKHPSIATLALHAGGDLGALARWRVRGHVAACEQCRDEVSAFERLRTVTPELRETPEIPWNRLAAEMRANIRLGLEAGACVPSASAEPRPLFSGGGIFRMRTAVALASVLTLVVTGLVLEHPKPRHVVAQVGTQVQASDSGDGIQVGDGAQSLRLMNTRARDVLYTVGAQGSVRARYVDPDSGYVTINNVEYAE